MKTKKKPLGKPDKILLLVTILLIIIGIFSIISASSRETVVRYELSMYHFFNRHMLILVAASIISIFILAMPTFTYKSLSVLLFAGILVVYAALYVYGSIKRGNVAWFEGGGQPSEFAKPIIIVALSVFFSIYYNKIKKKIPYNFYVFHILFLLIGFLIPIATLLMGDTGTALLTSGIVITMYIMCPIPRFEKIKGMTIFASLTIVCFTFLFAFKGDILSAEQKSRFNFYDPCSKYEDSGYQICNGLIAMNDGGLLGLGLGKSKQKYSYIPDPHTDSIFAIVVEETGLIIGLFILGLYYVMITRILKIAYETNIPRNKYICIGIAAYVFMHILFNLGGLLAIFPLTGVPLPLISYGGSFTVSFIAALAVVQRIKMEI